MGQPGYVYLIHALGTKRYKIGRSLDVNKRLNVLGQQCPFPLKLLASACVIDYVKEEKRLHKLAKPYHAHGEWFDLPDDWLRDIKSWFYDSGVTKYSGNGLFLLLSQDAITFAEMGLTDLQKLDRAVQLLASIAKNQASVKVKNELFAILGRLPENPSQAGNWKGILKKARNSVKSGTGTLDGIL